MPFGVTKKRIEETQLASQTPSWYDNYEGTPPPSQPRVPSGVMKRKIDLEETQASQIPPWYDNHEGTPPPSQPRVPSGGMKRKAKETPHSDLEDEEIAEFGMEIDTDMPCEPEVRTTASVSLFCVFMCSCLVDITTDIGHHCACGSQCSTDAKEGQDRARRYVAQNKDQNYGYCEQVS